MNKKPKMTVFDAAALGAGGGVMVLHLAWAWKLTGWQIQALSVLTLFALLFLAAKDMSNG